MSILPPGLFYKELAFSSDEYDSGSRNEPTFYLDKNIRHIQQVRIDGVEFPNSYYVFNSQTNSIKFTENGEAEATATITPGNYTSTTILTEIKAALEAVSPDSRTYTVTLDTSTLKITIAVSSGTVIINGATSTAGEFIGFTVANSTAASVEGNQVLNLSGPNYLILRSNLSALYNRSFYVDGKSANNAVCRVPVHSNSSEVVFYDASTRPYHQCVSGDINDVSFYLTDEANRRIDLNGGILTVYVSLICAKEEQ